MAQEKKISVYYDNDVDIKLKVGCLFVEYSINFAMSSSFAVVSLIQ